MDRERIVETARKYIGTPFKHMGRDIKGIDCVGLLICIAKDLGLSSVTSPMAVRYPKRPGRNFLPLLKDYMDSIPIENSQGGDVAVISWVSYPCHCGILTNEGTIIHAHAQHDAVIEEELRHITTQNGQHILSFKFRSN